MLKSDEFIAANLLDVLENCKTIASVDVVIIQLFHCNMKICFAFKSFMFLALFELQFSTLFILDAAVAIIRLKC